MKTSIKRLKLYFRWWRCWTFAYWAWSSCQWERI